MLKDKFIIYIFSLSLAPLVISGLVAFFGLPIGAGNLILRFDNLHNEVTWAGSVSTFYGILGVVLVISAINFALAKHIYEKEKFISYAFAVGTGMITLLFLIAAGSIAFIN
ncbi:MAG: hypothetical protein PHV43_00145 [Candidatus Colwellbacteria bacterium]|nr:hypothetical protein [Candidatus Colwellbacteria bacterium]